MEIGEGNGDTKKPITESLSLRFYQRGNNLRSRSIGDSFHRDRGPFARSIFSNQLNAEMVTDTRVKKRHESSREE